MLIENPGDSSPRGLFVEVGLAETLQSLGVQGANCGASGTCETDDEGSLVLCEHTIRTMTLYTCVMSLIRKVASTSCISGSWWRRQRQHGSS